MSAQKRKRSVLKQLQCPNCGTALSQYTPGTQTIICPNCGSYVAVGAGDPEVTGKSQRLSRSPKPIELGTVLTIDQKDYMVLGRVMYSGWDDEESWRWNEWMLGAEDGRTLWLSYDEKGFGLFKKERFREQFNTRSSKKLTLGDKNYFVRERYPAKILGAEGELTWRAKENDQLFVAEGGQAKSRFSVQQTDDSIEVYTGTSVSELDIAKSTGDAGWVRRVEARIATGGYMRLFAGLAVLFAIGALSLALALSAVGENIEETTVELREAQSMLTLEFDQPGRPALVSMRMNGGIPVGNYVDVDVSVEAPDGTESYLFTKSFWHETGVDEDGRWVETDYNEEGRFVPLESGRHRLIIEVSEQTFSGDLSAEVRVRRNIWVMRWLFGYAFLAAGLGIFSYMSAPNVK